MGLVPEYGRTNTNTNTPADTRRCVVPVAAQVEAGRGSVEEEQEMKNGLSLLSAAGTQNRHFKCFAHFRLEFLFLI